MKIEAKYKRSFLNLVRTLYVFSTALIVIAVITYVLL